MGYSLGEISTLICRVDFRKSRPLFFPVRDRRNQVATKIAGLLFSACRPLTRHGEPKFSTTIESVLRESTVAKDRK